MHNSTRLALLALYTACASAPQLIPSGDKPAWAELKKDSRFPAETFVLGVGMLPVSGPVDQMLVEQLDASARRELAKVLRVDVQSALETYSTSVSKDGKAQEVEEVEQATSEVVDMQLSGVEIAERWLDEAGKTAYALAVADKAKIAADARARIASSMAQADEHASQGDAVLATNPGTALRQYLTARTLAGEALAAAMLVQALGGKEVETPQLAAYDARLSALASRIALTAVEGDGQRVTAGKPLSRPLVVKAELRAEGGQQPFAGLPISFAVGSRGGAAVSTGPDGLARLPPGEPLSFEGAETKAVARLDWKALAGDPKKPAPGWLAKLATPEVSLRLIKKSLQSTRVVVKIAESIEEVGPVAESLVQSAIVAALTQAGFQVQDSAALAGALGGADKIASASDEELKEKARGLADVVVLGTATSRFNKKFAGAVVYHRARGVLRAVDLAEGKVLETVDLDLPCDRYGHGPEKAGAAALKALGEKVAPQLAGGIKAKLAL